MYAEVLVELKAKKIDKTFTYKINENLKDKIKVGMRVIVPFGKQKLEGFVLNIKNSYEGEYQLKEIIENTDDKPILNEELLKLGEFISKITLSTKIQAYQTMLPAALKAKKDFSVSKKYEKYILLNKDYNEALNLAKNELQKQIIKKFEKKAKILKKKLSDISISSVATLLKNNVIKEVDEEVYRNIHISNTTNNNIMLTEKQNEIVEIVFNTNKFVPYLLHGVTGSGKTEVYMNIIRKVLDEGKTALVLVPEISLTPQFVAKFQNKFEGQIAILHSKLSNGEKYDEWRKIENKEVSVVIGTRSAIFAPLTNIGVIVIDEEHSDSYKQENNPKYNAISIALFRAKYHDAPLLLGSATPTIESYTRAKLGIYKLLELKERINTNLPKVELVSMKEEIKKGNSIFSSKLINKINDRLQKQEQVIILLNKRGYARIVTCHDCGYTDKCPHCDIPLTYHKSSNTMRCHYCGYGKGINKKCPNCNSDNLSTFGIGTQKLEEEIKRIFDGVKVLRMDADTTSKKSSYDTMINDFKNQKYNILVGTQMIAKGLDFDNVTLVGVVNADSSLNVPDFRSAERTFSLLNQVAGRAGRGTKEGEVIFEGFNMDHYSIIMASTHDYEKFYNTEIELRKKLNYPPYCNLSVIEIKSKDENLAFRESEKIKNFLAKNTNVIILGPAPNSIPKINDYYYYKIILKYKNKKDVYDSLLYLKNKYDDNKVYVDIDLNPINL